MSLIAAHRRRPRRQEKKTLLLSDLHVDLWRGEQVAMFEDFVSYAAHEAKEVILLGDLFDLPTNDLPGLSRAFSHLMGWFGRWREKGVKITWLVGNHDILLGMLPLHLPGFTLAHPNRKRPYLRMLGGRVVYLEHGHAHDPLYTSGLYAALFGLEWVFQINSNLIGAALLTELRKRFPQLKHIEPPAHRPGLPDVINQIWERAAQDILGRFHCEGVIFGHTHTPQVTWYSHRQFYLNTGTWLDLATYVEATHDALVLRDWRTGRVFGEVTSQGPQVAPYCSRVQGAPGKVRLRPAS